MHTLKWCNTNGVMGQTHPFAFRTAFILCGIDSNNAQVDRVI